MQSGSHPDKSGGLFSTEYSVWSRDRPWGGGVSAWSRDRPWGACLGGGGLLAEPPSLPYSLFFKKLCFM